MVYGTRFEIGRGVILTEGSNPSFSANTPTQKIWVGVLAFKDGTRTPCLRQQGLTAGFASANFHSSREAQTAETEHSEVNPSLSAIV